LRFVNYLTGTSCVFCYATICKHVWRPTWKITAV